MDYSGLNIKINELKRQGAVNLYIGEAKKVVPVKIGSVNKHALKRGITKEEAQSFVDQAIVMFDQGSRLLYISSDGSSVVLDAEKRLVSAYRKADYDSGMRAILEVVRNG